MISKAYRNKISGERGVSIGILLVGMILFLFLGTAANAQERYFSENAWSFGVMADTQWYVGDENDDPEGVNPEFVSAALARAFQNQFINEGVRLVVQVGDLTDRAGDAGFDVRAAAAQPLFDAGIGFFPLRGNHETYGYLYSRDPDFTVNVPGYRNAFPQTQGLSNTYGATNFSNPDIPDLLGLSYSFDYGTQENNARFVIVDVEASKFDISDVATDPAVDDAKRDVAWYYLGWIVYEDGAGGYYRISSSGKPSTNFYGYEEDYPLADWIMKMSFSIGNEYWPSTQQSWISDRLNKNTRGTEHAFVFSHRGLMGANHADGFFGSSPASKSDTQGPFYASLEENGVKYMLSGHDHLHNRAIVTSPDGANSVQQIIHMAGSTKFYGPGELDGFSGAKPRETPISQDLYNVGYYIYTIDGPRVHVEYYADSTGNFMDYPDYPHGDDSVNGRFYLPPLDFVKKESWGYSNNGQEYMIAQGDSYMAIGGQYNKTTVQILNGVNSSTTKDRTPEKIDDKGTDDPSDDEVVSAPRPLTKVVNTGWLDKDHRERKVFSDIFSIWGMGELGQEPKTDEYVIAMQVDMDAKEFNRAFPEALLRQGKIGIAALNSEGEWVNAVTLNVDSYPRMRPYMEPYDPARHKLGDWGIIPNVPSSRYSKKDIGTVWAVVNYNADFAVAQFGQKAACFNCYKKK